MCRRWWLGAMAWCVGAGLNAAELTFNFAVTNTNALPPGFRPLLGGAGAPGEWKVIFTEVPGLFPPVLPTPTPGPQRPVLAQLSHDPTDERFPMLVYEPESFTDFTLTTKFKLVAGTVEQMAGIAFRLQDERNYYYVRASGLGGTLYFYEVVDGQRRTPVGNKLRIATNTWHELTIECQGNAVRARLDGQESFPTLHTSTFAAGRIAFWTKSDSVTYFYDTRLVYKRRLTLAQQLVVDALKKYTRLVELTIYAPTNGAARPTALASSDAKRVGQWAPKEISDVITNSQVYYGKSEGTVIVTLPLRDSNGEPAAAVRVVMNSFPGQTEKNAVARAVPVVKAMEPRVRRAADLFQ